MVVDKVEKMEHQFILLVLELVESPGNQDYLIHKKMLFCKLAILILLK